MLYIDIVDIPGIVPVNILGFALGNIEIDLVIRLIEVVIDRNVTLLLTLPRFFLLFLALLSAKFLFLICALRSNFLFARFDCLSEPYYTLQKWRYIGKFIVCYDDNT